MTLTDWIDDIGSWLAYQVYLFRSWLFPARFDAELMARAEVLAARPYMRAVAKQDDPPIEYCWLAYNPDFPHCMADGRTREEAYQSLDEVRALLIYTYLEDGLPVPRPYIVKSGEVLQFSYSDVTWLTPQYDEEVE